MLYTHQSKRMEYGKLVITLFNWFGIPVTVLGILMNIGTWESKVLFVLAAIFLLLRIIYFAVEKEQLRQKRNIDLEKQRYELDKEKQN